MWDEWDAIESSQAKADKQDAARHRARRRRHDAAQGRQNAPERAEPVEVDTDAATPEPTPPEPSEPPPFDMEQVGRIIGKLLKR